MQATSSENHALDLTYVSVALFFFFFFFFCLSVLVISEAVWSHEEWILILELLSVFKLQQITHKLNIITFRLCSVCYK